MSTKQIWLVITIVWILFFSGSIVMFARGESCPVEDIMRVKEGAYLCESWVHRFGPDRLITSECLDLNRNAGLFRYFWYEQPSCAPYRRDIEYIWEERNKVAKDVEAP